MHARATAGRDEGIDDIVGQEPADRVMLVVGDDPRRATRLSEPLGHPSAGSDSPYGVSLIFLGGDQVGVKWLHAAQLRATSKPRLVAGRPIIASYQRLTLG